MNDKELLELAAKAAGYLALTKDGDSFIAWSGRNPASWNPLTDDGDALRLAIHLDINVHTKGDCVYLGNTIVAYNPDDIYAATRRAIVRAAAEIGKEMK